MDLSMFINAVHVSQKVGVVQKIVNVNAINVGTVNVMRGPKMITIIGAEGMENRAAWSVGIQYRIAAKSVAGEREMELFATKYRHEE